MKLLAKFIAAALLFSFIEMVRGQAEECAWPCPEVDLIFPCTCVEDPSTNFDIDCSAINNEVELRLVFDRIFPFNDVNIFTIDSEERNDIRNLTSGIFSDKSFNSFSIRTSNLSLFGDDVLTNSHDTLVYLKVHGNEIKLFPFEAIKSYTVLYSLDVANNELTFVPEVQSESLITLNINYNYGVGFPDGENTFAGLPNLKNLKMEHLGLTGLITNMFSMNTVLRTLSLSNNELTAVLENAINPASEELRSLYLNDNQINVLQPGAISG